MKPGDAILLARGGHKVKVLDDAKIIEVKQGPTPGSTTRNFSDGHDPRQRTADRPKRPEVRPRLRRERVDLVGRSLHLPIRGGFARYLGVEARRHDDERHDGAPSRPGRGRASARATRSIVPDLTMIAVPYAVLYTGAKPAIVDVDRGDCSTWTRTGLGGISEEGLPVRHRKKGPDQQATDRRPRPGHPARPSLRPSLSHGRDPDALAREYGLLVIEDAAEAHGALYYPGRR